MPSDPEEGAGAPSANAAVPPAVASPATATPTPLDAEASALAGVTQAPSPAAPTPAVLPAPLAPPWRTPTDLRSLATPWLQAQQPRLYWRLLAGGAIGLAVVWYLIITFQLGALVPLYDLAFGLLVPATVVLYWWEHGAPNLVPRDVLAIALAGGALAGLLAGLLLLGWLQLGGDSLLDAVVVAVIEEVLKIAAVAYLLLDARLRREIDGLLLGFVAVLGFSALQTASYGFITFQQTNTVAGFAMFRPAIANMDHALSVQLLLQLCGDWVWTAILCAAIWRERGTQPFALTRGVGVTFGLVVVLHTLWTYSLANNWLLIQFNVGYLPLFTALVAIAGFVALSFFIQESRQRAALGAGAPAPPPLDRALVDYVAALPRGLWS